MRQHKPPANITEVVARLGMQQHLPVFVLNGYEDLTLFKDLDDDELDYLGITDENQREKLIEMANFLFPDEVASDDSFSDKDDDEESEDSSESGIADVKLHWTEHHRRQQPARGREGWRD